MKKVIFGSADCHIVDVVKETEHMVKRLKEEPTLLCTNTIKSDCNKFAVLFLLTI